MCAIAGVSFAPGSTLNRRKLANALLTYGEVRGTDASGFAYVSPTGDGVFKKDVPGSKLHVGALPQDATAMILHTRASTHGSPRDNENNHPIISPEGRIRLVHNGVIHNHAEIRKLLGKAGKGLPEVDSSVIGALIEQYGVDQSDQLAGYASAAWFDTDTEDTIHLARFKTSTVFFATLWDNSIAFASTADILGRALNKLDIPFWGNYPSTFDSMDEGDYYQLLGGEVISESEVEWKKSYTYTGRDYSAQTSGGARGTTYTSTPHPNPSPSVPKADSTDEYSGPASKGRGFLPSGGSEDKPKALVVINHGTGEVMDSTPTLPVEDFDDITVADLVKDSRIDQRSLIPMVFSSALAAGVNPWDDMTAEEFETWATNMQSSGDPDMPSYEEYLNGGVQDLFYTEGHDGDYVTYTTLNGLIQKLKWESHLTATENHLVGPDEGELRWVNQIADLGSLNQDGSETYSWVRSDSDFQAVQHLVPSWVGDGVAKLRHLVGA